MRAAGEGIAGGSGGTSGSRPELFVVELSNPTAATAYEVVVSSDRAATPGIKGYGTAAQTRSVTNVSTASNESIASYAIDASVAGRDGGVGPALEAEIPGPGGEWTMACIGVHTAGSR